MNAANVAEISENTNRKNVITIKIDSNLEGVIGHHINSTRATGSATIHHFKIITCVETDLALNVQSGGSIHFLKNVDNTKTNNGKRFETKEAEKMFKYGYVPYFMYSFISLALFIGSGTMFVFWRLTDISYFNPVSLFMLSIMSLGWFSTGVAGIWSVKKRSEDF